VKNLLKEESNMIARTWTGRTRKEDEHNFLYYVLDTGIKDILRTRGNCGAWLFRRHCSESVEFFLISFWDSFDAIRAFAGSEIAKAKYYSEDDEYLLEKPEEVIHYDVFYPTSA
jgi:heme-degrading monooxygenase HmoA